MPPPSSPQTERQFQGDVVRVAHLGGWRDYHTFNSKRSVKGFPDLVLVRERVIWVELKTDHGKLSTEQKDWLAALAAAGQEVYVWRPSDIDELSATLLGPRASATSRARTRETVT